MRSQGELKVIAAQLEVMEESRSQLQCHLADLDLTITRCKEWMQDKGLDKSKTKFEDLLVIFGKLAEKYQAGRESQSFNLVCDEQITSRTQNTGTKDDDVQKKIQTRLNVLEMAISSLNPSNNLNENSVSDLKDTLEAALENIHERMSQNEQKADLLVKEQLEHMTVIKNVIIKERENVNSLKMSVQVLEEKCKEEYKELAQGISDCNGAVTLLKLDYSSMSRDMENVADRFKAVDREVISLKSSLQSLSTSCEVFMSESEMVKQEQLTTLELMQAKLQTLQEQSSSSIVLLLKKQNTLRDVLQGCVKKQDSGMRGEIQHLKSEIKTLSTKQDLFKPTNGFLASASSHEKSIDWFYQNARSIDSTELNMRHKRNTELMLAGFTHISYSFKSDFNPSTGIFRVRHDGLYLIHADVDFGSNTVKRIFLGLVIRVRNKVATLYTYKHCNVVERKAQLTTILNLLRGQEICLFHDEGFKSIDDTGAYGSGEFSCSLLT